MDPREADEIGAAGEAPSTADLFARLSRLQQDAGAPAAPTNEPNEASAESDPSVWFAEGHPLPQDLAADASASAASDAFDVDAWQPEAGRLSWQDEAPAAGAHGFANPNWSAPDAAQTSDWAQTLDPDGGFIADVAEPIGMAVGEDAVATEEARGPAGGVEAAGRKRRKSRVVVVLAIVAVLALALAGVGLYLHKGVSEGVEDLNAALELIGSTDNTVIAVDKAVNEDVSADTVGNLTALIDEAASLQETLDEAATHAQAACDARWVGNDDRAEISKSALQDIEARKQMLELGAQIIDADYDAYRASDYLNQAWPLVVSADTRARNSAATASAATTDTMDDDLPAAIDEAQAAVDELQTARELIEQAQAAMPEADFSTILAYIDAKIEAVSILIEADQAMLDGDEDEHSDRLDAFAAADEVAVSAAAAMPADPSAIITDAYTALTADTLSSYYDARFSLVEADTYIRDYLGVEDLAGAEVAQAAQ